MTPEERRRIREMLPRFRELPPEKRDRLLDELLSRRDDP
jgi:hypothetical protein